MASTCEESAVCYLQILLADQIAGFGRARMLADMDAWGYTFRLGSAQAWFEQDATDARDWLLQNRLIDARRTTDWPCARVVLRVAARSAAPHSAAAKRSVALTSSCRMPGSNAE